MISNVSNVIPIHQAAPAVRSTAVEPPSLSRAAVVYDTVEFSPLGRAMARAAAESTMRLAQISAIRSEIERGTYETPERIQGTVARLLKDLA